MHVKRSLNQSILIATLSVLTSDIFEFDMLRVSEFQIANAFCVILIQILSISAISALYFD